MLVVCCFVAPLLADSLPNHFRTPEIKRYLETHDVRSVEDFLGALPDSHRDNMVFVYESHSLQSASRRQPRQILFGWDGRMIVAVGNNAASDIEFADFDAAQGEYHFREIHFVNQRAVLDENPAICKTCHGSPTRPIWHDYGNWPGVYGDELGGVPAGEKEDFLAFTKDVLPTPRYRHLKPEVMPEQYPGYRLPLRKYGFPTTVMNFVLGNTVAIGTLRRIEQHPAYAKMRWALLALSHDLRCESKTIPHIEAGVHQAYAAQTRYPALPSAQLQTMTYRLLGIDPGPDLNLTDLAPNATATEPKFWDAGGNSIDQTIGFLLLQKLMADDATMKSMFTPRTMQDDWNWITAEEEARIPLENYPYFARHFTGSGAPERVILCAHLDTNFAEN